MTKPVLKYRKAGHRAWPVDVTLQQCDEATGEVTAVTIRFVVYFTLFSEDDYLAAVSAAEADLPQPDGETAEQLTWALALRRNAHVLCKLVCGWGPKVVGDDDRPLQFSQEALTGLITGADGRAMSAGFMAALLQLRHGVAPAKNSQTSPSPGQGSGEVEAPTS